MALRLFFQQPGALLKDGESGVAPMPMVSCRENRVTKKIYNHSVAYAYAEMDWLRQNCWQARSRFVPESPQNHSYPAFLVCEMTFQMTLIEISIKNRHTKHQRNLFYF